MGSSNLQGIAWMALSGLFFVAVTAIVRHLGSDMNAVQAAFIRYAFGLVLLAPVYLRLRHQRGTTAAGSEAGVGSSVQYSASCVAAYRIDTANHLE